MRKLGLVLLVLTLASCGDDDLPADADCDAARKVSAR